MSTLTENDLISTAELNRQIKSKGYKQPFGLYLISIDFLIKKGFVPAVKLKEGMYWNRDVLNNLIKMLEDNPKQKKSELKKENISQTSIDELASNILEIKTMLKLIMNELDIGIN